MSLGRSVRAGEAYVLLSLRDKLSKGLSQASRKLQSFGAGAAKIGAGVMGAGLAGGALLTPTITAASEMQETMSKFGVVFGESSEEVKAWSDNFAAEVGRSKQQIASFMAGTQDLFVPLGFDQGSARAMSQELTTLAVDLASFNNMADADVLRDLQAALTGSGEVMKKYGVLVNEAAVKQELLNQGIDPKTATDQAKVQARLAIIMRGTTAAHGDAIRTGDSYANQMKRLTATFDDLKVIIGNELLPIATDVVAWMVDSAKAAGEWIGENRQLVPVLAKGVVAVAAAGAGLLVFGGAAMLAGKAVAAAAALTSAGFNAIAAAGSVLASPFRLIGQLANGLGGVGMAAMSAGAAISTGFARGATLAGAAVQRLYTTSLATMKALGTAGAATGRAIGTGVAAGMSLAQATARIAMGSRFATGLRTAGAAAGTAAGRAIGVGLSVAMAATVNVGRAVAQVTQTLRADYMSGGFAALKARAVETAQTLRTAFGTGIAATRAAFVDLGNSAQQNLAALRARAVETAQTVRTGFATGAAATRAAFVNTGASAGAMFAALRARAVKTAHAVRAEFGNGGATIRASFANAKVQAGKALTAIRTQALATFAAIRPAVISAVQVTSATAFAAMKANASRAFARVKAGAAGMYASVARNAAGVGSAIGRGMGTAGGLLAMAGAVGIGGAFAPLLVMAPLVLSALGAIGGAAGALLSPFGLLAAALGTGIVLWGKYTESGQQATGRLKDGLSDFKAIGLETFAGIREALEDGDLDGAAEIALAGLGAAWNEGLAKLMANWGTWITGLVETFAGATQEIAKMWLGTQGMIANAIISMAQQEGVVGDLMSKLLGVDMREEQRRQEALTAQLNPVRRRNLESAVQTTVDRLASATDPAEIAELNRALANFRAELGQPLQAQDMFAEAQQQIDQQTQESQQAVEGRVGEFMGNYAEFADPTRLREEADARRQQLTDLREEQRRAREEARDLRERQRTLDAANAEYEAEFGHGTADAEEDADAGVDVAQGVASAGTFSAWAIEGMFGRSREEEQLEEARQSNRHLDGIGRQLRRGGVVLVG